MEKIHIRLLDLEEKNREKTEKILEFHETHLRRLEQRIKTLEEKTEKMREDLGYNV